MSDFLGEAHIRIRPDTTTFAAELKAQVAGGTAATAAAVQAQAALRAGAAASTAQASANTKVAVTSRELTAAQNLQTAATRALAFANLEATNVTGQLAIANAAAGRAGAAVAAAEKAVAAARIAGNAQVKKAALDTLTEAQAKHKSALASLEVAKAQQLQTAAASKLIAVNRAVTNVTSELAAAQIIAGRANIAVLAAERAVVAARASGNAALIKTTTETLGLAAAQEKEALTALEAAKAQTAHASSLGFVRRGALASILSLVGVRGATLAANSAFLIGAAAIVVFAKSLGTAAKFERELNVFRVTAGATADEMERVAETAVQLGADITLPGVSAGDAAEAMTELAKAGLSVQDAIEGARGVLQLATAANISNADATTLAASALNAFGLAGNQAVHVADVLANAANAAQGSIQDMGFSLQQAAAVGRQVGLSLEDTTVFLTSLTRAGLRGSDAGTSLRTSLLRLINPTKKIQAVFDELGLSLRDTEGNFRTDFFVNLGLALEGLSEKQRDAKLAILGGADAIRALSILSRQSIKDLIGLRNAIRDEGTAAEVAAARTAGLGGAGLALKNTLENVGLSIGRTAAPGLTDFANSVTAAIGAISASASVRETLGDSVSIIGNAFQALGAVLSTVGPPLIGLAGIFQQTISAIGVAEVLAAVAAFKLYPAVLGAATTATNAFTASLAAQRVAIAASSVVIGGFGRTAVASAAAGLTALRASALAFAASATGVGLAVAALAAGLIFLLTREGAAERATRHLKDSTDALRGSLSALISVTDSLARSASNVETEQLSVVSAQLAAAQARQSLANSSAAKGSLERRQLENALAIALDNVRLAEQRLAESREEQRRLADEQSQAERNLAADRLAQVASINELVDAAEREASVNELRLRGLTDKQRAIELENIQAEAIDSVVKKLHERADVEAEANTAASRETAKRLRLIADVVAATGRLPSEKTIDILIRTPNFEQGLRQVASQFGITGKAAVDAFVASLTTDLPKAATQFRLAIQDLIVGVKTQFEEGGLETQDVFWRAFIAGTNANKEKVAGSIANAIGRSNAKVAAIDRQALDLEIAGAGPGAILANLRAKRAEQERIVARQERRFASGDIAVDQVTKAKEDLAETVGKIRTLEEEIRGDAESAAREIEQARDRADQAAIDAFTGKRTRLESLLIRAGGNEGLGDDIKFNKMLVTLLRKQIKLAADRIKSLAARRDFINDTNRLILQITNQIKDDEQKQKDLLRQRREDRQQERDEKLRLNIEFAQINENVRAEIRARQARIRALQAQQRQILKEKGQRAKNTAAYLELRNEIAREKAAIKELREEQDQMDNEAQKLIFQFLQAQQGFAANLLSNLFPSDMSNPLLNQALGGGGASNLGKERGPGLSRPTDLSKSLLAGLEGFGGGLGEAAVRNRVGVEAGVADARDRGPTAGQSNVQITLLREIRDILRGTNKGSNKSHPEAHFQRAEGRAALDILGP